MKRKPQDVEPGRLPRDIAAGPRDWPSHRDWMTAGREWSKANLEHIHAWKRLLDPDVIHWSTSLGRHHAISLEEQGLPVERRRP